MDYQLKAQLRSVQAIVWISSHDDFDKLFG